MERPDSPEPAASEPRSVPNPFLRASSPFLRGSSPFLNMSGPTRPDSGVAGVRFPIVDDLSLIAADDQLLDSIVAGRIEFGDLFSVPTRKFYPELGPFAVAARPVQVGGSVAPLLATWRSALVALPVPAPPQLALVARTMTGPAARPRRALRPMLGVAAGICALLIGSTAIGAHSAKPGETLWALNQILYTNHAHSVLAAAAAQVSLKQASGLLDDNEPSKALVVLVTASVQVENVEPGDGQQVLQFHLDQLNSAARRSETTPPTSADGGSGTELALAAGAPASSGSVGGGASAVVTGSRRSTSTSASTSTSGAAGSTPSTIAQPAVLPATPGATSANPTPGSPDASATPPPPSVPWHQSTPPTVPGGPVITLTTVITVVPSAPTTSIQVTTAPSVVDTAVTTPPEVTSPPATSSPATSVLPVTSVLPLTSNLLATTDPSTTRTAVSTTSVLPTPTPPSLISPKVVAAGDAAGAGGANAGR